MLVADVLIIYLEHLVSRSVLREAVRLLKYHAVATMRRGPGGGLVVAQPQAQAPRRGRVLVTVKEVASVARPGLTSSIVRRLLVVASTRSGV
jgi:hypothetical protein